MTTFADMQDMAAQTREAYRELERAQFGKEWNVTDLFVGVMGDVGELAQLLGARGGLRSGPDDLEAKLAHELADVLWSVLVIAREIGVDLDAAFAELHTTLLARIATKLAQLDGR